MKFKKRSKITTFNNIIYILNAFIKGLPKGNYI